MNRKEYAALIEQRLREELSRMKEDFRRWTVQSCYIDNLLPEEEAKKINTAFPDKSTMMLKKSLRENKYVAAQMNKYPPILEEIVYAFQEPNVLKVVEEITGIREMVPDTHLYAGGISLMAKDNFLNPHLDNSHDKERERYRVLNLLYYVTPDWSHEAGGNLELWDEGPEEESTGDHQPLQPPRLDGYSREVLAFRQPGYGRSFALLRVELLFLSEAP